jgi:hypothetical protein
MTYYTDLDELPKDKPTHYYVKEIQRAQRQLSNHKNWLKYYNDKLKIMKDILKERGVDEHGRIS